MSPYSIAVAPDSSFAKREKMVVILELRIHAVARVISWTEASLPPRFNAPRDRGDFAGQAAKQRRSRRRFRPIGGDETAAAGN
jgi:hypothetical protein